MSYPRALPRRWRPLWSHPWWRIARKNPGFKRWCRDHGYLSPHFTRGEAACHDGSPVPSSLLGEAQHHAFNLERFRHKLGGPSLPVLSWYRTPSYNAQIGGASQSRHMSADATDFSVGTVQAIGTGRWDSVAADVFRNGGRGRYPGGSRHLDSRGYSATWTSF